MDHQDSRKKALTRYEIIAAYVVDPPPRGQRTAMLRHLASKTWHDHRGEPFTVSAETLRVWIRRYRKGGIDALQDKPRPRRGVRALSDEVKDLVCAMKREVPERSLDRILHILEETGAVEPGVITRSTLHRVLRAQGLSGRPAKAISDTDLDRFEADAPNQLWQSDMLVGPWLPDPDRPGKVRRCYLYAFLDDHSRMLLAGRFFFKGDLPALELVFRTALRKFGRPDRVYYDNGKVYRSDHMRSIVATIGTQGITFTHVRRPMGHGKIEAFNQLCRSAFLAEAKASGLQNLDAINEAFLAWVNQYYNVRVHSETQQAPIERWRQARQIHYLDEQVLQKAFLWKETRKADKTGVFTLFGTRYQVGAELARRRVTVRYDPEQLDEVEVWSDDDNFVERARPLEIHRHRRPTKKKPETATSKAPRQSGINWLGHLVDKEQASRVPAPPRPRREGLDDALVALLRRRVHADVFDEAAIRNFLDRYGPFETEPATVALDRWMRQQPDDLHVNAYLEAIRDALGGA